MRRHPEKSERMTKTRQIDHEVSSGNVFEDLGFPDAQEHLLRARIVTEIYSIIKSRNLTQTVAAAVLGITQPQVSRMLKGNFGEYSVDRLMRFLTLFDRDVDIVIRKKRSKKKHGKVTVKAAYTR